MNLQCIDLISGMTLIGDLVATNEEFILKKAMAVAVGQNPNVPNSLVMAPHPISLINMQTTRKEYREEVRIKRDLVIGDSYAPPSGLVAEYTRRTLGIIVGAPGQL